MAIKLFIDFDGTITTQDAGDALFRSMGGPAVDEVIRSYHAGIISARECFLRKATASGGTTKEAVDRLLDEQKIDPHFRNFVAFCAARGLTLCVLSDGLDYYIDRILAANDLTGVVRFSNLLSFVPVDSTGTVRMELDFPAENAECDRCACCKRNIMLSRAADEDFIVYVGEGYSDRCPAGYADLVFAKDSLQTHCQRENISYLPYQTFHDVQDGVEKLLGRKHLRPRRRAALQRAAAFIAE